MPSESLPLPRCRRRPASTEHPQTLRDDKYMYVLFNICRVSRSGSIMYFWGPTHRRSTHRRSNHPCSRCACCAISACSYAVAVKTPSPPYSHKHLRRIPCALPHIQNIGFQYMYVMGYWGSTILRIDALVIYHSHPGVGKACYMRAIPVPTAVWPRINNY